MSHASERFFVVPFRSKTAPCIMEFVGSFLVATETVIIFSCRPLKLTDRSTSRPVAGMIRVLHLELYNFLMTAIGDGVSCLSFVG